MIEIVKEKTVAITGHRFLREGFDKEKVKLTLLERIRLGYDTFLIGMAVGFDTVCFQILEEIRRLLPIKIIACIPCEHQDQKFSFKQQKEYKRMLDCADERILVSKEYTPYCMQKRNMFMVDNSNLLIAYLRESKGGAKNTVEYAKNKNVSIIFV